MIDFQKEYREKMLELVPYIGKECSENFSPTLTAKLLSIDIASNIALMEVLPSPYSALQHKNFMAGETYVAPLDRIWNAFLF